MHAQCLVYGSYYFLRSYEVKWYKPPNRIVLLSPSLVLNTVDEHDQRLPHPINGIAAHEIVNRSKKVNGRKVKLIRTPFRNCTPIQTVSAPMIPCPLEPKHAAPRINRHRR